MNVRFFSFVAWRYLFSNQKQHTINLITRVSMIGVAIGTMALVIVLSVLNGFEAVVKESFNNFDPELRITAAEGKTFSIQTESFDSIKQLPNVAIFSEELQEMALLSYDERQGPVLVKGVDVNFQKLTCIDTLMYSGHFITQRANQRNGAIGIGVAGKFNAGVDYNVPMVLYAPRRTSRVNLSRPDQAFTSQPFFVSGVFSVQQPQYDDQLVILPIAMVRKLFDYSDSIVSAINLKMSSPQYIEGVKSQVSSILGNSFIVSTQYEQQEDFYRILQIEKWITFLILAFILLIATCNVIGSLSMLMIDKQNDITLFKNIGATDSQLRKLFLLEGWLITIFGALCGLLLGVVICLLQQHFGIIKMGSGYIVEAYPVVVQFIDLCLVFVTVLILGFFAAYYPARLINRH